MTSPASATCPAHCSPSLTATTRPHGHSTGTTPLQTWPDSSAGSTASSKQPACQRPHDQPPTNLRRHPLRRGRAGRHQESPGAPTPACPRTTQGHQPETLGTNGSRRANNGRTTTWSSARRTAQRWTAGRSAASSPSSPEPRDWGRSGHRESYATPSSPSCPPTAPASRTSATWPATAAQPSPSPSTATRSGPRSPPAPRP